jgi:hypothetical protein
VRGAALSNSAEQTAAMFGRDDFSEVGTAMRALAFNTNVTPLTRPVLIPEGGADPLVPPGTLSVFKTGNEVRRSRTLAWPDWQHSIYERVDGHGI